MNMPVNGNVTCDHDWSLFGDMKYDFGENNIYNTDDIINTNNGGKEEFSSSERRGSLAQRRAAKLGFDVSKINVSPQATTDISSPPFFFTIPSGISPAALLESPVMLPNYQISPTTGAFPLASLKLYEEGGDNTTSTSTSTSTTTDTFGKFKLPADDLITTQIPSASIAEKANNNYNQAPQSSQQFPSDYRKSEEETSINKSDDAEKSKSAKAKEVVEGISSIDHHQSHQLQVSNSYQNQTLGRGEDLRERREKRVVAVFGYSMSNNDGYYWRKYGQKHVKGSEFPRSYYKCNTVNCTVKKKVERCRRGEITEIVYDGRHNHPQPLPTPPLPRWCFGRVVYSSSGDLAEWDVEDKDFTIVEGPSSASGSNSPGVDADGNESEAKRRRKEILSGETYIPSRSTREPRFIFQIISEVDVLEDGYKWRKYGQKVVKGNPNPRSYYKCTTAGCPVRKHVERASDDKKSVLTSYEGKHNHIAPAAKTHGTAAAATTNSGSNRHPTVGIQKNKHRNVVPNPDIQVQDLSRHYQMKPNLGDLVSDIKLGHSSSSLYHQMKFPPPPPPPLHYANTNPNHPFVMNAANNANTNYPFVMNAANNANTNYPFVMNTANRSGIQTTPSSCFAPPDFAMTLPLDITHSGFALDYYQQPQQHQRIFQV